MSDFSAYVHSFSQSGNVLFRNAKLKSSIHISIIVIGECDESLAHELRVIAAAEVHVNALCIMYMYYIKPNILHWNQFMEKSNQ